MDKEALKLEPPPECQTEAEKTAFAFGWFKAMEAQRTWVSLTDEQIKEIGHSGHGADYRNGWGIPFARAIETKLKEKNT